MSESFVDWLNDLTLLPTPRVLVSVYQNVQTFKDDLCRANLGDDANPIYFWHPRFGWFDIPLKYVPDEYNLRVPITSLTAEIGVNRIGTAEMEMDRRDYEDIFYANPLGPPVITSGEGSYVDYCDTSAITLYGQAQRFNGGRLLFQLRSTRYMHDSPVSGDEMWHGWIEIERYTRATASDDWGNAEVVETIEVLPHWRYFFDTLSFMSSASYEVDYDGDEPLTRYVVRYKGFDNVFLQVFGRYGDVESEYRDVLIFASQNPLIRYNYTPLFGGKTLFADTQRLIREGDDILVTMADYASLLDSIIHDSNTNYDYDAVNTWEGDTVTRSHRYHNGYLDPYDGYNWNYDYDEAGKNGMPVEPFELLNGVCNIANTFGLLNNGRALISGTDTDYKQYGVLPRYFGVGDAVFNFHKDGVKLYNAFYEVLPYDYGLGGKPVDDNGDETTDDLAVAYYTRFDRYAIQEPSTDKSVLDVLKEACTFYEETKKSTFKDVPKRLWYVDPWLTIHVEPDLFSDGFYGCEMLTQQTRDEGFTEDHLAAVELKVYRDNIVNICYVKGTDKVGRDTLDIVAASSIDDGPYDYGKSLVQFGPKAIVSELSYYHPQDERIAFGKAVVKRRAFPIISGTLALPWWLCAADHHPHISFPEFMEPQPVHKSTADTLAGSTCDVCGATFEEWDGASVELQGTLRDDWYTSAALLQINDVDVSKTYYYHHGTSLGISVSDPLSFPLRWGDNDLGECGFSVDLRCTDHLTLTLRDMGGYTVNTVIALPAPITHVEGRVHWYHYYDDSEGTHYKRAVVTIDTIRLCHGIQPSQPELFCSWKCGYYYAHGDGGYQDDGQGGSEPANQRYKAHAVTEACSKCMFLAMKDWVQGTDDDIPIIDDGVYETYCRESCGSFYAFLGGYEPEAGGWCENVTHKRFLPLVSPRLLNRWIYVVDPTLPRLSDGSLQQALFNVRGIRYTIKGADAVTELMIRRCSEDVIQA